MHYFDVFEHPVLGVKSIKHGFSWPALFFGPLWALGHRLWLPALLLCALTIAVDVIAAGILASLSVSVYLLSWLSPVAAGVFAGFNGNDWCRSNLSKRGFTYVGTYQAPPPDAAVTTGMHKRATAATAVTKEQVISEGFETAFKNPLINCTACGKRVSAAAKACPNCGHPVAQPAQRKTTVQSTLIIIGIIAAVVVLVIAGLHENSSSPHHVITGYETKILS